MNHRYPWPVRLACGSGLTLAALLLYMGLTASQAQASLATMRVAREPPAGFLFRVDVENRWSGTFNACAGIGSRNDVVEQKVATKTGGAGLLKVPGMLHRHDVTLTRALTSDTKLWSWRQEVVVGKVAGARQKCTITMLSSDGKPMAVWELTNAWPADLKNGTTADGDKVIEEVTIAHEGVTRKQ